MIVSDCNSCTGYTAKILPRIHKKIFMDKFPCALKIFVNNRIRYIGEADNEKEIFRPRDAIERSLRDMGVSSSNVSRYGDAMISILREVNRGMSGWKENVREMVQEVMKAD